VNYTEGIIKNTEFFTTTELAKKLKMNVQVITRKVQAGEIRAYKIGKEWRIPEPSVFEWLESNVNTREPAHRKPAQGDVPGRQCRSREQTTSVDDRNYLLEYVLAQFEPNRLYREDEVDSIIDRQQADSPAVRRELVTRHMMEVENGLWRRCRGYRLSD